MCKVFCIGANKTGTTSLLEFFRHHGFSCGDQASAELLFVSAYAKKDWAAIIDFAEKADFHQDLPFSAAGTYKPLSIAFPKAHFILSKRRNAEDWYDSLVRFHARKFGDGQHPPTAGQLKAATYRYAGFMWDANRLLYPSPPEAPYQKADLLAWYEQHLHDVRQHFAAMAQRDGGPSRLLEIEIEDLEVAKKIAAFVGFTLQLPILPHVNQSTE
jgi:hypothetical protein